ncbi:DUF58 domain-containing protein [Roseivirga sp. BDSF3-8]|uniref:DUF58 domain-containing protein n=1 Tax=Roseivirga sp. BDSF3-8 TaxID=3241598 RepID=UPI00353183A8
MDLKKIREVGNLELLARQMVEGFITGLHKSPYHGFSVEFAEHRLYNSGESTRHIDWKVYAKTDRLYTKRYEEETNLRGVILLDHSPSMYYPAQDRGKLTFSCLAAASLAYLLNRQRDAVGLVTFAEGIETQTDIKSTHSHLHTLYAYLEKLLISEPSPTQTNVSSVLHEVAEKIHKRSLVVLFSDMFEQSDSDQDILNALRHLKHRKHEVLLFHVTDKKTEQDFSFEDRPYEFIDMETGEKVKLQPSQYRETYIKEAKKHFEQLKLKCGQFGIDFIEADINEGVNQVLSSFLVKRTKMK